ncbi:MAG: transglycosylase SLT domain-containing protein [Gemmatimonadota bacterium]
MTKNVKYFVELLLGLGWRVSRPGRRAAVVVVAGAVLVGTAAVYGGEAGLRSGESAVDPLEARAAELTGLLGQVEDVYAAEIAPIERVLMSYRSDDRQLVRRVAVALTREARRAELEPRLLLAVLLVENPWIDPEARSPVGAQGLMQVMPFHRGQWEPCAPRLDDIASNICHGAQIFASYLKSERGNVDRALLRYNGCVRGTNTPDCHQYPTHVYARAGRASIMAWRSENRGTMAASR